MNTVEIFNKIADRITASGSSEKAKAFAEKIRGLILEKGEEWIEKNKGELQISEISLMTDIAPIENNRLFYLQKWQLKLADK